MDELICETIEANLPYTKQLPDVDWIEVQHVSGFGRTIKQIIATDILVGAEARSFSELWRIQKFDIWGAMCHFPAYTAKFCVKDTVYLYATICWQCNNIYLYRGESVSVQGFNGEARRGQDLLEFFKRILPPEDSHQ